MTKRCCKCGRLFYYEDKDCRWDYKSGGFDAKLVNCRNCEAINIVKYWCPPNREEWYYRYDKKKKD